MSLAVPKKHVFKKSITKLAKLQELLATGFDRKIIILEMQRYGSLRQF